MSKEWNIQRVLYKHFQGIDLPELSSIIYDYPSFLEGKLEFDEAEPIDFARSNFRSDIDIGLNPRTSFLVGLKKKIQAKLVQFVRIRIKRSSNSD
jgi:hypothetical protein